ncbi:hypothetical protein EMCRGX_G016327 [Ephydatia muelleri]
MKVELRPSELNVEKQYKGQQSLKIFNHLQDFLTSSCFKEQFVEDHDLYKRIPADVLQRFHQRKRHISLRKEVVNFLENNPHTPDGSHIINCVESSTSWEAYLSDMAKPGTWGTHIELQAIASLLNVALCIITNMKWSSIFTDINNPMDILMKTAQIIRHFLQSQIDKQLEVMENSWAVALDKTVAFLSASLRRAYLTTYHWNLSSQELQSWLGIRLLESTHFEDINTKALKEMASTTTLNDVATSEVNAAVQRYWKINVCTMDYHISVLTSVSTLLP